MCGTPSEKSPDDVILTLVEKWNELSAEVKQAILLLLDALAEDHQHGDSTVSTR